VHAARLGRNGPTGMVIPLSMPSWMLTGLVFAATTVLMLAAICQIWYLIGPFAYGGGDGKMLISEIEVFRRYAPPFASHILNPLDGHGSLQFAP
jgi:hypothetical protein